MTVYNYLMEISCFHVFRYITQDLNCTPEPQPQILPRRQREGGLRRAQTLREPELCERGEDADHHRANCGEA